MFLPLYLGVLHAVEPDHVAVVTGVSLSGDRRGAWKVGLAFGLSHMLAVALLAAAATFLGSTLLGDGFFLWMDRLAWALVLLLGLWNLAAALGLRSLSLHSHAHRHGPFTHEHPHPHGQRVKGLRIRWKHRMPPAQAAAHGFHHSAAWLGAFFGLGGVRGFTTLLRSTGTSGQLQFLQALLLFGLGITAMFTLPSALPGLPAPPLGPPPGYRRTLYALSGLGNVAVGLYLLIKA